jgi:hypothetical protein
MGFTGNEDHSITLEDAAKLTANYRQNAGAKAIKGGFFGKTALKAIIDQEECVGIRFYYGQNSDGTSCMVLVGTDASENDMISGLLAEREWLCPPFCGEANVLNSD